MPHRPTPILDQEVCRWLEHHGVVNEQTTSWLLRIQPGKLAAYTFGYGNDDALRLCADLIAWLFLFDDAYAEGSCAHDPSALHQVHAQVEAVLAGREGASTPFTTSIADLFNRLREVAPQQWISRLVGSLHGYFVGCEIESSYRMAGRTPTMEGYLAYRDGSVGVYPMLDLIELARGTFLSPSEASAPWMTSSRRAANLVMAMTNDLYSASKEATERESFNAVLVSQRQWSCTWEQAIAHAQGIQQRLLAEHHHFASLLSVSEAARLYVSGVDIWIDGNQRWSSECPRYNEDLGGTGLHYSEHRSGRTCHPIALGGNLDFP